MSMDFPERLRNNCLTSIEDYRNMQVKLHAMKKERESVVDQSGKSEEWKSWELAPLDTPVKRDAEPAARGSVEPSAEAVNGVHKALRTID